VVAAVRFIVCGLCDVFSSAVGAAPVHVACACCLSSAQHVAWRCGFADVSREHMRISGVSRLLMMMLLATALTLQVQAAAAAAHLHHARHMSALLSACWCWCRCCRFKRLPPLHTYIMLGNGPGWANARDPLAIGLDEELG
jgi:hypothetical protein